MKPTARALAMLALLAGCGAPDASGLDAARPDSTADSPAAYDASPRDALADSTARDVALDSTARDAALDTSTRDVPADSTAPDACRPAAFTPDTTWLAVSAPNTSNNGFPANATAILSTNFNPPAARISDRPVRARL